MNVCLLTVLSMYEFLSNAPKFDLTPWLHKLLLNYVAPLENKIMGKVRDSIYLLEGIHLITTLEVLAEFSGTFTFSTYSKGSKLQLSFKL